MDKNYLVESSKWVFRLYTVREICLMLRISRAKFYRMKDEGGLFVPMHRRAGYGEVGETFYTDRQVFEAIIWLYPDIRQIEIDYLLAQVVEVPDNATFKERRKPSKKNRTQKI